MNILIIGIKASLTSIICLAAIGYLSDSKGKKGAIAAVVIVITLTILAVWS